ncbi:hypothetical protein SAMN02745166_01090 [Prosthecobacter debontii]|uniref:N-acetyltransferase domain-containing protein n=1 Tax=Prosthecobacter debontii TaxID=48467 RepID=A0A1T4X624_9BACT|nr:hypothetical protein [Prosthecobacter debontii]SKA85042.1 hypothetical protein SAMN02745166_01090 [Prosthecobacter debontii]
MIRRLHPWELSDVIPIAREFHGVAQLGGEFDEANFMAHLNRFRMDGRLYAVGSYIEDRLVGALVGILAPHFMCRIFLAQELFWYVMPEHRAGSESLRMVKDFEAWARERKAFACIMATFHNADPDQRLPAVFERLGFPAIETHHFKPL